MSAVTVAPFPGFKRAVRESVGLLIGLASPSGGGKTFSAMLLAKGMSGGKPFAVIDTEAGRAKHYADQFAFDHADLRPPFRPEAYARAIAAADAAGYPVIVVDSMSHEHAGEGGLLDWHEDELDRLGGEDYAKRERVKMTAWIRPKSEHKRMVSRLLQLRAHLILCFRAEQKTDIVRKDGKTEIVPKKTLSGFSDWIPVAEKNLLFELTTSFVLSPAQPGFPIPIKLQEQHRALFPLDKPISEEAGARIAEWARGGQSRAPEVGGELASGAPRSEPSAGSGSASGSAPAEGSPIEIPDVLREKMRERVKQLGLTGKHPALPRLKSMVVDYLDAGTPELDIAQAINGWKP